MPFTSEPVLGIGVIVAAIVGIKIALPKSVPWA
jgi:hypothetical protein